MVMSVLGAAILLTSIVIAYTLFASQEVAQPLVVSIAELRNSAGDPVQKAKLISRIDDLAADSTEGVQDQWAYMTECLPAGCVDDEYLNLILIVAQEHTADLPAAELITNIIIAHRFWGGEDVVEFSRALSDASDAIELRPKQVRSQWDEVIACNGECAHMNDLFFELLVMLTE